MVAQKRRSKSKPELKGDALKVLALLKRVGVPDAAAILDMHPYTLREYLEKGYIHCIMLGKRPFITEAEIERYKEYGKRVPAQDSHLTGQETTTSTGLDDYSDDFFGGV